MKILLPALFAVCLFASNIATANVYTVTSNANSGTGTLRQAINDANNHNGADSIKFNLADTSVLGRSITLNSGLPSITGQVIIDGTSQVHGKNFGISFAKIQVTASISLTQCFNINADYCEIYGIFISGFQTGIAVNNAYAKIGGINKGNVVFNCSLACIKIQNTDHAAMIANLIGVDTAQNAASGVVGDGIDVLNCYAVAIGGHSFNASNVISGNSYGVKLDNSQFCDFNGNFIGTSTDGSTAIPNQYGIKATGLNNNMEIGGDSLFERNIISGNVSSGIYGNFSKATIQGNYIGTDATGTQNIGNGEEGIFLTVGSSLNLIGGEGEFEPNVIAFNGKEALVTQTSTCLNNTFRRNTTFCNSQLSGNGGFKLNNGNNHILPPQLIIANANGVSGLAYPLSIIDLYQDDTCSHCEGAVLIASVTANANGVFSYVGALSGTVTGIVTDTAGNSSEYAQCVEANNSACIVAGYSTSPAGFCTNTVTTFLDQSVSAPGTNLSSWQWNFGDGATSSLQSPTHSYSTIGTYTVTLVVSNSNNCFDTLTNTITVTGGPVAAYNAPFETCIGSPVNFIDQSTAGAGATLTNWNWNFGDGGSTGVQNPTHTFNSLGTFTITFTVTNNNGCTDQLISSMTVIPQPVASFSYTQTGLQVSFANSSTTSGQASYSWNFGDGVISNAQSPSHTYSTFGLYTVCLNVYDSVCSATDSVCHVVDLPDAISSPLSSHVILLPNPVQDDLIISGLDFQQPGTVAVYDMVGRKMLEEEFAPAVTTLKLNLRTLPQGLYMVTLKSGDEMLSRKISVIK